MPLVKAMSGLLLAMDLFVMLVETGALMIRLLEVGALVVRLFHFVTMMRLVPFAGIPGKSWSKSKGTENDRRHECQADIFHWVPPNIKTDKGTAKREPISQSMKRPTLIIVLEGNCQKIMRDYARESEYFAFHGGNIVYSSHTRLKYKTKLDVVGVKKTIYGRCFPTFSNNTFASTGFLMKSLPPALWAFSMFSTLRLPVKNKTGVAS